MSVTRFTQSKTQIFGVHAARLGFYALLLISFFVVQSTQPQFMSLEVGGPWLGLLAGAFALQSTLFLIFDKIYARSIVHAGLFLFDVIFVTAFLAATGVKHTVLFFCYLLIIILCGFVYGRKGAMAISIVAVAGFFALLLSGAPLRGQSVVLLMMFNVFAFVIVGYMAGYLSEQLNFMGFDVERLQDLNELIVGNVGTGLMTLSPDGAVLQINAAGSDILELNDHKSQDLHISKVWPQFFSSLKRSFEESKDQSISRFELSFEAIREQKLCECVVSLLTKDNQNVGYVVLFEDITRSRRLEMSLHQNEKLAAVGALASGIAHEIRNPLASISGSVQLLQSFLPKTQDEPQRLMRISLKEIDRLNDLISEFLEYVRPEELPKGQVDLGQLLQEVAEIVRVNPSLKSDVAQSLEIERGILVAGDYNKLKQAFLNIVLNAYQAMESLNHPATLFIKLQLINNKVMVSVRDNGQGMEDKTLKRLFEPFHTTKPRGTGLGLAMTRKILQSHGAEILVQSQRGQGAEFIIEFPQLPLRDGLAKIEKGRAS